MYLPQIQKWHTHVAGLFDIPRHDPQTLSQRTYLSLRNCDSFWFLNQDTSCTYTLKSVCDYGLCYIMLLLNMKGFICQFVNWQIHPFMSKGMIIMFHIYHATNIFGVPVCSLLPEYKLELNESMQGFSILQRGRLTTICQRWNFNISVGLELRVEGTL